MKMKGSISLNGQLKFLTSIWNFLSRLKVVSISNLRIVDYSKALLRNFHPRE